MAKFNVYFHISFKKLNMFGYYICVVDVVKTLNVKK